MLDRSAVNGSLLPLGEEPSGEERLDGGAWLLSQGYRRFVLSVFSRPLFSLPLALPLANFSTTAFLASPLTASQVVAVCDCFARDFRGAAADPSVFSYRFSGTSWETSVLPCLEDRFV